MKTKILRPFLTLLALYLIGSLAMQAAFVGGRTDFRDESIYFVILNIRNFLIPVIFRNNQVNISDCL